MADLRREEEDLLRALVDRTRSNAAPGEACPEPDLLAAFLGSALLPEERQRLETHLVRCPRCLRTVGALAGDPEVVEEPTGLPPAPVRGSAPPTTAPSPSATTSPTRSPTKRRWVPAAVAALALLALGAWVFFSGPAPQPRRTLAEWSAAVTAAHPDLGDDLRPLSPAELARPGAAIERGGLRLHTPVGTELTTRPAFRFRPVPGVVQYELRLLTLEGRPLWTATTGSQEMPYPPTAEALQPGASYLWEVSFDRLGRQSSRRGFRVATEEERTQFRARQRAIEETAPQAEALLLTAHLAIRRGYWSEARALLQDADPEGTEAQTMRATRSHVRRHLGEEDPADEEGAR